MNRENVLKLIDLLSSIPDERFDIGHLWNGSNYSEDYITLQSGCGTAACVAGWAIFLRGKPEAGRKYYGAQAFLGLTNIQAQALFTPPGHISTPEQFTRSGAIKTLQRSVSTGKVDWSKAGVA